MEVSPWNGLAYYGTIRAMATDQEILDAARSALLKRMRGDAYEEYNSAEVRFRGTPLRDLEAIIRNYEARVAAANGGSGFINVEGVY